MKGYIIYSTYRIINNKPCICLFGKLENNQSFLTINHYKPYFYIKSKDKPKDLNTKPSKLKTFTGNAVTKVFTQTPQEISELRKKLETYEADIKLDQRFLMDKNIKATIDIEGDYTEEETIDRVYKEPELKPAEPYKPKLKILSIDIETDEKAKEIYSIALYTEDYKKVLIRTTKKIKNAINCKGEEDLLEEFIEQIRKIDPDLITGWNFIDFDLKIISKRLKHLEINFNIARDNSKTKLRIQSDFFRTSKAEVPGRQVLDALELIRSSFIKLNDYKLDTAANHFLKDKKLLSFVNKGLEISNLFKKDPQKLADYNLKDAELVYKILEKSGIIDLAIQKTLLTGLTLEKTQASIKSLDSLYIREANKRGIVCPTGKFTQKQRPITGGYVMQPEPGIYQNVLIMDFKSLYPSLIRTYNIDPYSLTDSKTNTIEAPNKARFKNQDGILPSIIENLWKAREKSRKNKNELERYAIKTLMNSFYGVLGSPSCRFFDPKIANAITSFAQETIKNTTKLIEKKGYKVIYADTDSCFVVSNTKNLSQANKVGKELKDHINNYYNKQIKIKYKRESFLEMEYEKCYTHLLMPKLRGKEKGAKKRYAGLVNDKLEFTGLEMVRSDWTELAKKFHKELYLLIFNKKDPTKFIKTFVNDLTKGKYDKLLIYKKAMRKSIEEYTRITPSHVKAAKKLKQIDSYMIRYVMTEDGPEPVQNIKHKLDYKHYIDKQIKPIADSILTFFKTDFDEVIGKTKQTSLFGY